MLEDSAVVQSSQMTVENFVVAAWPMTTVADFVLVRASHLPVVAG